MTANVMTCFSLNTFVTVINRKRLEGGWYEYVGEVQGKDVKLKGWKTWLQRYEINGVDYQNLPNGAPVKQFKLDLLRPFFEGGI